MKILALLLIAACAASAARGTAPVADTTMRVDSMKDFTVLADTMMAAMELHAKKLGVTGVMVVARMNDAGSSWVSTMRAVGRIKDVPDHPEQHPYPGYNFVGIAYSKAAEMADTKLNSGGKTRPPYQGEFGYPGGLIVKVENGFVLAVFSGATSDQDVEIARAGIDACPGHP